MYRKQKGDTIYIVPMVKMNHHISVHFSESYCALFYCGRVFKVFMVVQNFKSVYKTLECGHSHESF